MLLLLDRNVEVSQLSGGSGDTSLYCACEEGHTDIVQLLLDKNADMLQCSGKSDDNPLYVACKKSHTNIVVRKKC